MRRLKCLSEFARVGSDDGRTGELDLAIGLVKERDMDFRFENFTKVAGTLGNDDLLGSTGQITFGLSGNDTLRSASGSEYNFLVGGQGDDTYIAGSGAAITILDTGGHDTVVATGLGLYSSDTYVGILAGRHLIAANLLNGQQVVIANWQNPANSIETVQLAEGTFSLNQIASLLPHAYGYLGNVSMRDAIEVGILSAGTTSNDLQHFLNQTVEYELSLEGALAAPPPAAPIELDGVDADYYLAQNPDVAAAGIDPTAHYLTHGWREDRDPNAMFDTSFYLGQNPDVAAAQINPLAHFMNHGVHELRDPSAMFDTSFYLETNQDVAAAQVNPLLHYMDHGASELRDPNAWMDLDWYLGQNSDVQAAGVDPLLHYWNDGWKEGRNPSEAFDTNAYLAANLDVQLAGINPLEHWITFGMAEGRPLEIAA